MECPSLNIYLKINSLILFHLDRIDDCRFSSLTFYRAYTLSTTRSRISTEIIYVHINSRDRK